MPPKVSFLPATRKHRLEMKVINELELPENYELAYWEGYIAQHRSQVAMLSGQAIGYCLCSVEGHIISLAVRKEHQGKGYGKQLLRRVIVANPQLTYSLHVRSTNQRAINLYQSLDFKIEEVLPKYYDAETDGYHMIRMPCC